MGFARVLIVFSLLLSSRVFGGALSLQVQVIQLIELEKNIHQLCLTNPDRDNIRFKVEGAVYDCRSMLDASYQIHQRIKTQTEEACTPANSPDTLDHLAEHSVRASVKAVSCQRRQKPLECVGNFECLALSVLPAGVLLNAFVPHCAHTGNACVANFLRGIFDSIFGSIKFYWSAIKWASAGLYHVLRNAVTGHERRTSDKGLLAQKASPGIIREFLADPVGVAKIFASVLFSSLESSIRNHYGCEAWSGIPFRSQCLRPMTNWKCADCQQIGQVMCGIIGYVAGDVITNFLTGGAIGAGKVALTSAMKVSGAGALRVAGALRRILPEGSGAVTSGARAISLALNGTKKTLEAFERTRVFRGISKAVHLSGSGLSVAHRSRTLTLLRTPLTVYLKATRTPFLAGQREGARLMRKILR